MRELYNDFFYIPKHGRVREKVMLTRVALTVVIMVACLVAMSITAYAYFSYNVTSGSNIIKTANFEANVSITIANSRSNPVTVTKDGKVQTANLEAGEYTIELTKGNSTANKGFCVITIGNKKYYTDQIGVDIEKKSTEASVKFTLLLSAPTKIEVLSHWGTSVYYGYEDTDRTEIFIDSDCELDLTAETTSSDDDKSENITDQTEETTTTPSTGTDSSATQTSEGRTTPSTKTTKSEETTPHETTETSEPTSTKEPNASTTEPTATQSAQSTETIGTESTEPTETQSAAESTEMTGTRIG